MVAMNPQTWDKDVAGIEPGGYLFYDSTKPLPPSKFRGDINVIGMPLTEICNKQYSDPRQRQLFKNIMYVGALSQLLEIEPEVIETLIREQYKGKDKLIAPNIEAFHIGRDYAKKNLPGALGLKVKRADKVRRPDLHRGQCRGGARLRLWWGHGRGLVSDHALDLHGRSVRELLPAFPRRCRGQQQVCDRTGRG